MSAVAADLPYETAQATQYASDVARRELMGIESTRKVLGRRVELAVEEEVHTVMTKHGQPAAVIVDMDWYRRAAEAVGEPTEL